MICCGLDEWCGARARDMEAASVLGWLHVPRAHDGAPQMALVDNKAALQLCIALTAYIHTPNRRDCAGDGVRAAGRHHAAGHDGGGAAAVLCTGAAAGNSAPRRPRPPCRPCHQGELQMRMHV